LKNPQTYSFIINPVAGGKKKKNIEQLIKETFNSDEIIATFYYTQYPTHAYEFAKKEVDNGTEVIVAVGGDGTINEVARALIDTESVLGIIPLGSGNGFARHFNLPLKPKKALSVLKTKNTFYIDVGMLNEKAFFCTSGLGFDAETGYRFSQYSARGFLSYALSFFKVFKNYIPSNYKLIIDGKPYESSAFFINIANISQFGYHFYISPEASAKDGFLDLVVVKEFPKIIGIFLAFRSFFGTIHRSKYVHIQQSKEIKVIKPLGEKVVHIDGDPDIITGEINYTVQPSCLKLILPTKENPEK
jgi:YegS/Rv2252/BmrU family lipid kinase